MKIFTVFVAFSLLVAFACAQSNSQFDFRPRVGDRISLGGQVTDSDRANSVKTGTVDEQEIFACEKVTHAVSSVSTSGPFNSGSKFQVTVEITENLGGGSLSVTFGTTGQTESFQIHELGDVTGVAPDTFSYYCENYPSSTTLEVLVEAESISSDPIIYTVTVTQYVSDIKTITQSRTLRQTSPVLNLLEEEDEDAPEHVAGQNFVHYYHNLVPSLAESRSTAYIVVDNWNWEDTIEDSEFQTAYVCVSLTSLVMLEGSATPSSIPYTDGIAPGDLASNTNPCQMWCVDRNIMDEDNEIRVPIGSCEDSLSEETCGLPEHIWIGIIPPSPVERSTYDIKIVFEQETLAEVIELPAGNGFAQGFLSDDCVDDKNPCRDYYDISDAPSGGSSKFGPYLSVELFAVNNGEVQIELYDGHIQDPECACTPAIADCSAGDVNSDLALYCTQIIHPCNYDRNIDYTLVVSAVDGSVNLPEYSIEYALNTFVGEWPSEIVTASSFNKPSFGTIKPLHYNHYEITFTADQLSPSSYFQTELYSLHEENSLEFFWRFGDAAGRTDECFGYDGKCSTYSDCESDHVSLSNNGHCRFLFVPCDAEANYFDYAESIFEYDGPDSPSDQTTKYGGLKVSKLQPGTYYFAVRGNEFTGGEGEGRNVKNEYTYTITWNLQEEIQVFDGVPVPNSVHYLDYSQQYVFNLPKLDSLYRLRIRTSYVFNGFVDTTISCEAGFCACGGVTETVNTGLHTPFWEANDEPGMWGEGDYFFGYSSDIHFDPICRGCKDKIYITVRGSDPATEFAFNDLHKPIPYVLTVHIEPFSKVPVPILSASRAGYHHNDEIKRAADSADLHLAFEETYDEWTKFYKVSFANAEDFRNDAFLVDLTIVPGVSALKGLVDFYFGSPSASLEIHTLNDCTVHGLCFAGTYPGDNTNFNGEIPAGMGGPNFEDGLYFNWSGEEYDVTQGSCRVALQPCSLDSCISASSCGNSQQTVESLPNLDQEYHTTAFDRNLEYYIVVRDWSHPTALYLGYPDFPIDALMGALPRIIDDLTNIFFKLSLQVVEQTPLPLIVDQPVYGHVGAKQYIHFRYDVGSISANSKLVFEVYRNHNEEENLFFYINHWDGSGPEVWAGESYDCLATGCPGRCELSKSGDKDVCTFEVSPCDLKSKTGTYFLSVSSGTLDYVWGSSTFGVHDIDFTISATHIPAIELLGGNKIEGVERGLLNPGSSLYYSVTVPRLSSGVIGRVMNVELENIQNGAVEVIVSRDAPEDQCGCSSHEVYTAAEDTTRHVLRRTSCEVDDTSTFYITVTGVSEEEGCVIGFVLRAYVFDVTKREITLTTDRNKVSEFSQRILRFDSDSENNALNEFTIGEQEIVALTWRTTTSNAPQGSVMEISIEQDGSENVPVTLGAGSFVIPGSTSGVYDGAFGPEPDTSNCPLAIKSGDLTDTLDFFVDACEFPNSNTEWHLLFSGESLGGESGVITVRIRVVPPETLVLVPATNSFDVPTLSESEDISADEVDFPIERRVFISNSLGLSAGQSVEFTIGGASNVEINYNAETNVELEGCTSVCSANSCTVSVCENLTARPWYFAVTATGVVTFEVTRMDKTYEDSTTSAQTLSANSERTFSLAANEWQYFRVSIPAATDTAYRIFTEDAETAGVTFYTVDSPFIMPGETLPGDVLLSGDGTVLPGNECGVAQTMDDQSGQCCYDRLDLTFVATASGDVEDATIELQTASLQGTTGSLSFGSNSRTVGGTSTGSAWKPAYLTFNVPENTGFYYEFAVPEDAGSGAQFYLGRTRAGSSSGASFDFDAEQPVYDICYEDTSEDSALLSPGSEPMIGFINPCEGDCSVGQWILTVIPVDGDGSTEFTYTLTQVKSDARTLRSGSTTVTLNTNSDGTYSPDDFIEYKYDFTTVNNNWVPVESDPLFDLVEGYLPPRLVFQADTFILDGDEAGPEIVDIEISDAPFECGVTASDSFDTDCFDDSVTTPEGGRRCAKSFCDVPCGTSFYVKASRVDSTVPASFRLTTSIANAVSISGIIDIQAVSVSRSSVTRTWRSTGDRSAVYFKADINLDPNSWVDVIVNNFESSDESPTFPTVQRFVLEEGTCYQPEEDCTIAAEAPCVFSTAAEDRCSLADSDFTVYYRIGYDDQVEFDWEFEITFEVQTTSPMIDRGDATTLESGESYTKTKFIPEDSWQFYTFNLVPELGYDHFNFEITVDGCGGDLEVYTSWLAGEVFHDWVRSNRWPVNEGCSADSSTEVGSYTNNLPSCHTFGGEYRVAIYAPEGSASILGGDIVYTISAELVNVPHVDLDPYCKHSQEYDFDFISRYEFLVDASNRGSILTFHLATDDTEGTYTLWASKNANPYPSPDGSTGVCGWEDEPGLYSVAAEVVEDFQEASLPIDICEFENDVWYLYVAGPTVPSEEEPSLGEVTVWATLETQYIPVAELTGETDTISWSASLLAGASQTYKVLLNQPDSDFLFSAHLGYPESECSTVPEECSVVLTYSTGSVGYVGTVGTGESSRICDGCVACEDCAADLLCEEVLPGSSCDECVENTFTEYFFTVQNTGESVDCPYVFEVSLSRAVNTLSPGDDLCIEVSDDLSANLGTLYQIPSSISLVTITSSSLFTVYRADYTCSEEVDLCTGLSTCEIENTECENLVIRVIPDDIGCGFKYGIVAEAAAPAEFAGSLIPITIGRAVEAEAGDYATFTVTSPVTVVYPAEVAISYTSSFGCLEDNCDAGSRVLLTAVDGEPTTYYFANPQGLVLTAAGSATRLTTSGVTVEFDDVDIKHFEISLPAGVTSYSIVLSDLTVDADDLLYGHSVSELPFTSCYCGFNVENEITPDGSGCGSEIVFDIPCSQERTHWFSVSNCVTDACAAGQPGFRIRVIFDEETVLPVVSGNHKTSYTVLESTSSGCGGELVPSASYVVEVTDILSVSLRNSHDDDAVISVIPICDGGDALSCTVGSAYEDYSCRAPSGCDYDPFSCYPPGLYEVSVVVAPSGKSTHVEFLVVNQWVALSGSESATIFGAEKHFYSVNAPESLSVSLSISSGPALKFIVFDGCQDDAESFTGFSESQVCASDCRIWIPTKAKHSGKSTYYIEIESKSIDDSIGQFAQNQNSETEKATQYTISTKLGTGNCAAPPSSGFCASTEFEGINVWSSITGSSVWSFVDPVSKDNEARCRFESYLTEGCGVASSECRSWLKVYSCLTSFPQCDASGFQTGICTDVCTQVRDHCSIDFGCCSDQFIDSVEGSTCYDIPPPPPPTTVSELPELEGDLGFDEFPPSLETPVFSTIQVYLPPADELFENIPLLKEAVVGEEISPAAVLVPGFIFCIFFVIGMF